MSFVDDLKNIDPNNPGLWPVPVKIAAFIATFCVVLAAGWHFDITKRMADLAALVDQESERLDVLGQKQHRAANLEPLRKQLAEMQQSFGDMVRQLPDDTEVAGLLIDISQTGLGAGLEFKLFRPGTLEDRDYYRTLPIEIEVLGNFHQFGEFVSGLVALPRIVTVHDLNVSRSSEAGEGRLMMKTLARTYQATASEAEEAEEAEVTEGG